jgi:hypothetical protein
VCVSTEPGADAIRPELVTRIALLRADVHQVLVGDGRHLA